MIVSDGCQLEYLGRPSLVEQHVECPSLGLLHRFRTEEVAYCRRIATRERCIAYNLQMASGLPRKPKYLPRTHRENLGGITIYVVPRRTRQTRNPRPYTNLLQ